MRRSDPFIGTEHLLIAVAGAKSLVDRGIDTQQLRDAVDRILGPSPFPNKPMLVGPSIDAAAALTAAEEMAMRDSRDPTADDLFEALLGRNEDPPTVAVAVLESMGLPVQELRRRGPTG